MTKITDNFATVRELAEIMRVSEMTVYRMIERGEIPAHRFGRLLRINRAEAEKVIGIPIPRVG